MGPAGVFAHTRVGWWAGAEPADPLAALGGSLVRAEMRARCPGLSPVLVHGALSSWSAPGFTGELSSLDQATSWSAEHGTPPFDIFVQSGSADSGGPSAVQALADVGARVVAVAPEASWGLEPARSVGSPFAVPEPVLLTARHVPKSTLAARGAYLRAVEGLPRQYVLVEGGLWDEGDPAGPSVDLQLALRRVAEAAGGERPAEVVWLAPGPIGDDPLTEEAIQNRRAEAEEGRYQPEDWPGNPDRPPFKLRVTSPLDLAATVAGAGAVVAQSGAMLALAWTLGVPHVALAPEDSSASAFAAWTGDASALAASPAEIVATIPNIFARTGRPPGFKRLEATLDQALDEAADGLGQAASEAGAAGRGGEASNGSAGPRLRELEAVNEALRQRLAAERLRFGERASLLEQAANTSVESAIKAVQGQDLIIRRRLELAEKELKRLQDETAEQQAELRALHASASVRALAPAREFYERLRKASR
ncbi:MAG TPA: hypothetical protein VEJ84_22255 [Acidimicrobiales bacterium]|nr:hypothetical protein [Acidimicrobiales bacterium]